MKWLNLPIVMLVCGWACEASAVDAFRLPDRQVETVLDYGEADGSIVSEPISEDLPVASFAAPWTPSVLSGYRYGGYGHGGYAGSGGCCQRQPRGCDNVWAGYCHQKRHRCWKKCHRPRPCKPRCHKPRCCKPKCRKPRCHWLHLHRCKPKCKPCCQPKPACCGHGKHFANLFGWLHHAPKCDTCASGGEVWSGEPVAVEVIELPEQDNPPMPPEGKSAKSRLWPWL